MFGMLKKYSVELYRIIMTEKELKKAAILIASADYQDNCEARVEERGKVARPHRLCVRRGYYSETSNQVLYCYCI